MASSLGWKEIEESTMVFTLLADVDQCPVVIDGADTLERQIASVYAAGGE
jgi:ribose 5-phosphate isomerase